MTDQTTNFAAVLTTPKSDFLIQERPVPSPGPGELLIRNHAVGLNPIDGLRQAHDFLISSYPAILGTDLSGVVIQAGASVTTFQPGDRIIGFAHGLVSHNLANAAFQTHVVIKANAAVALSATMTFAQGATLPTAVGTATMSLLDIFAIALPGYPALPPAPRPTALLVWGGASAGVGAMTVQLARRAGLTVFATASPHHHARLRALGVAYVVDYHDAPAAVDELVAAAKREGTPIGLAVDAISQPGTLPVVLEVLRRSGGDGRKVLSHTRPWPEEVERPEGVEARMVRGDDLWNRREDVCEWLYGEALPKWLAEGQLVLSPFRVVGHGVAGIQGGLWELAKGVSGEKLVVEM
ncbi:chaperonin 10-like protein [Lasiosphaeris hirsuta]|uniref:Chaperonin 10-like protein n=1 Tax=Lasiosphaeris hirsuta TaxID=260670 RepID=A0AA40A7K8_9PEZI|nr:chaperonin 10-like protein [Lasiosphaeris hirsuta]